jgi:hypothetical protein
MAQTALTAADVVERTAQPVLEIARGWLLSRSTAKRGEELGLLPGRGFWVNGRAGVLGDVDADVAAAGVGFMHPDRLRPFWETRPQGHSSQELAAEYGKCCADWGREKLAPLGEETLVELTSLAQRIAAAALPTTGALFAGWRAMPVPDDPGAAAALTLHVLRELRGGAHITAVTATGLTPLGAAMSASPPRGGADWARDLGWSEPYPDAESLAGLRQETEALTSRIARPAYEALAENERAHFVDLVERALTVSR